MAKTASMKGVGLRKRIIILVAVAAAITALVAGTAAKPASATVVTLPTTWCVAGHTISLNFSGDWGEYDYADAEFYQESLAYHGFWFNPQGDVGEGETAFGTNADNPQSLYPGRDEILYEEDDAIMNPDGTPSAPYVFYGVSVGACAVPAAQVNHAFYCYRSDINSPPAWSDVMTVTGYLMNGFGDGTKPFAPFWVAGNVTGGTNIGSGHLVCALPSGTTWDGTTLVNADGYQFNGGWALDSKGNVVWGGYYRFAH